MHLVNLCTSVLALAASTSAATLRNRQTPLGKIDTWANTARCSGTPTKSYEIYDLNQCTQFGETIWSAKWTPYVPIPDGYVLWTTYDDTPYCSGQITQAAPDGCAYSVLSPGLRTAKMQVPRN